MRRWVSLFMGLMTFAWMTNDVNAQGCCTVGASSVGGLEGSIQPYRTLRVAANYQFNSLTKSYQGVQSVDDPLGRSASVGYFNIQLEYGLQPRLSLFLSSYYTSKERTIVLSNQNILETISYRGSGIGDVTVLGKFQLITPTFSSPYEIAVGGGASLPTGSYTNEQSGSQLSIDLQPGTGAVTMIGWMFAMRNFPDKRLKLLTSATYRYAGANLDGYRLGDELNTYLGVEYSLGEYFSTGLYLKSRFSRKDFAGRRLLIGTGGTYHDLFGSFTYAEGASSFRIFGHVPVYRNVRGIQLTPAYAFGVEYGYQFDFRSLTDVIVPLL